MSFPKFQLSKNKILGLVTSKKLLFFLINCKYTYFQVKTLFSEHSGQSYENDAFF